MGALAPSVQRDASRRLRLFHQPPPWLTHTGGPPRSLSKHQCQHRCGGPLPGGRREGEERTSTLENILSALPGRKVLKSDSVGGEKRNKLFCNGVEKLMEIPKLSFVIDEHKLK